MEHRMRHVPSPRKGDWSSPSCRGRRMSQWCQHHLVAVGVLLGKRVMVVSNTSMARQNVLRRTRRPWTVMAASLTAAHHGFELSNGIGLVLQPELGLGPAGALWGTQLPVWIAVAA